MKSDLKLAMLFHILFHDRINQITASPLHVLEMLTSDCELAQVEGGGVKQKKTRILKNKNPEMS